MRIAASLLRPVLWGVRITLSRVKSGWSSGGRFLVEDVERGGGDDEAWGLAAPRLRAGYQHPGRGGILWRGGS